MANISKIFMELINNKNSKNFIQKKSIKIANKNTFGYRTDDCYENVTSICNTCESMVDVIQLSFDHLFLMGDHLIKLLCIKAGQQSKICSIFIRTVINNIITICRELTTQEIICKFITPSCVLKYVYTESLVKGSKIMYNIILVQMSSQSQME
ncbi:hypothetical protein Mgra_00004344 [Meloidogyne graminicola]|uniref:Saposin B-type domain-containing protein n=1 Tax=Meloidogyne graminicola TaxID=189291 RepID=A0A8S9ZSN7_9BILA|nr:hypothetical protein Mgra_00004344 [Meloidogyne graminicola]